MTARRILVVDDEPDVRRVVERSLARDPEFAIRTCSGGQEALVEAAAWSPELILLDVMMPGMDGPTTLAGLRRNPSTAGIPVIFLTARVQASELEHFKSIGAIGTIAKPFDPKALRAAVRGYLPETPPAVIPQSAAPPAPGTACADGRGLAGLMSEAELAEEKADYLERLQPIAQTLTALRDALRSDVTSPSVLEEVRTITHKLAGSAGLYGFETVSLLAAIIDDSIVKTRPLPARVAADLDALLDRIEHEQAGRARGGEDRLAAPAGNKGEFHHDRNA